MRDHSVGQILTKSHWDRKLRFIATGFIIAKSAYKIKGKTKGKFKLRILVASCAHTHREMSSQIYFSLNPKILKYFSDSPSLVRIYPLLSRYGWLVKTRQEAKDPNTGARINMSDLQVFVGETVTNEK